MSLIHCSIYTLQNPESAIFEVVYIKGFWSRSVTAVGHVTHWRIAESIRVSLGATYGGSNDIQRFRYIFTRDLQSHGKSNSRRMSKIVSVVVVVT